MALTVAEFKRQVSLIPAEYDDRRFSFIEFDGEDPFLELEESLGPDDVEELAVHGTEKRPDWLPDVQVHALRHGDPLCRFTDKPPKNWGPNDTWVSGYTEQDKVTCPACKHMLAVPEKLPWVNPASPTDD